MPSVDQQRRRERKYDCDERNGDHRDPCHSDKDTRRRTSCRRPHHRKGHGFSRADQARKNKSALRL
jgi:hypothetical protein